MFNFGIIASAIRKLNQKSTKRKVNRSKNTHPIHFVSKEQYYKWVNEGKCGCCGAESGEYKGICDDCRLS